MTRRLRVALVGGPMYDTLYEGLSDEVEVVVHADHLTLNQRVAEMFSAGERIDVLSTHGKYAPSQRRWLHPLDGLLSGSTIDALEPGAVDLCRDRGDLLCAPRNVDVRVMWWRTDRMDSAPDTWDELLAGSSRFGFTGRGSGLFGAFFEGVVGHGGVLFDDEGRPALDTDIAISALETIVELGRRCPGGEEGLTAWHYDEVDRALMDGVVDCAASWPGATGELRGSAVGTHLRPAPYPAGPVRRVSYSGCHGWAIPTTCGDLDGAVALLERLCSTDMHRIEASTGGIPARSDVLSSIEPIDDIDAERLDVTRRTIADAMITYPALERFPELEDTGADAISTLLAGRGSVDGTVATILGALDAVVD